MCMLIELVGGACDGRHLTICGDPTDPVPYLRVAEDTPLRLDANLTPPTGEQLLQAFRVAVYLRDPEPSDYCGAPL